MSSAPGPAEPECGTAGAFVLSADVCSSFHIARFFGLDDGGTGPLARRHRAPVDGGTGSLADGGSHDGSNGETTDLEGGCACGSQPARATDGLLVAL